MAEIDRSGTSIYQVLGESLHWKTPYTSLEETVGKYPEDILFVEVSNWLLKGGNWLKVTERWGYNELSTGDNRFEPPVVPADWVYNEEFGSFVSPQSITIDLNNTKLGKQNENKSAFESFLKNHPLTFTDTKQYGVTFEEQSEISLNMLQYDLAIKAGITNPILEWHSLKESCIPWTIENLTTLVLSIKNYVYPWFVKMNEYKAQIFACTTKDDVNVIKIDYRTEEEIVAEAAANQTTTV